MKKIILTLTIGSFLHAAYAEKLHVRTGTANAKKNNLENRAAGCAPGAATKIMDFNNVSCIIAQGGLNFLNFSTGQSGYEVPKGGNARAIYGNSLWMAGLDFNDQLKAATIVQFRNSGEDFWPGPLVPGTAVTDESTCAEYDKFYYANRSVVQKFYNDYVTNGSVGSIPEDIATWPAFGPSGQTLAPFFDGNGSGDYDPENGDIPWYQFKKTATELPCGADRRVTLYGDQTFWWVFNDKGNVHTESGGDPIGMEIHAQGFAFNTDDEINDMTFFNYELINRSTQTLYETFFGNFFDCDLGYFLDDYTGCDVSRGLGYVYNGDSYDQPNSGADNYGYNPPAIGVDYFEGPYKDNDGQDNPIETNYAACIAAGGVPYKGIGIGYGDGVVDNERFGMLKFMTYTGQGAPNANMSDPDNAPQAYYYLNSQWRDGSLAYYGGNGYTGQPGVSTIPTDYMFFYNTDPYMWATRGVTVAPTWREDLAGTTAGDRRFIESSGPFTLQPGAYNNITIGIVFARSQSGIPFSSVDDLLYRADDKAQALFDNCFKILEGPNAPDVTVQELKNELILTLTNPSSSNNYKEGYSEVDPFIILPDEAPWNDTTVSDSIKDELYRSYKFEGYKIYQLANANVKSGDLTDPDKARIVAQVDVKNGITKLLNWARDPSTGFVVPTLMVEGEDAGIKHSFRITTDAFTQAAIINHKTYYFMAVAYAFNEYRAYDPATVTGLTGQQKTYLQSRKTAQGEEVPVITAIPHMPFVENGGTHSTVKYGDGPIITRIEGRGNGGFDMVLTPESEEEIVSNNFARHPKYYGGEGYGPIEVKVIDPLNVTDHSFRVIFQPNGTSINTATWDLVDLNTGDTIHSDQAINVNNEQIFPEYGFSINISNYLNQKSITIDAAPTPSIFNATEVVRAELTFADPSLVWLDGVRDQEGNMAQNWIRAGSVNVSSGSVTACEDIIYNDQAGYDDEQAFEKVLNGIIAPYHLCAKNYNNTTDGYTCPENTPVINAFGGTQTGGIGTQKDFGAKSLRSVEIVFTKDKSKWTRCPVLETTDNVEWAATQFDQKQTIKELPSLDKNGNVGDGVVSTDPNDADFIAATGMSWFPGYVIDVETGVRLQVAFGEDSRYPNENGKDMKWNPTSRAYGNVAGEPYWGGKHYLYIFGNTKFDPNFSAAAQYIPEYDYGQELSNTMRATSSSVAALQNRWRSCSWVYIPLLNEGYSFDDPADMPCDARISIRVKRAYERYNTGGTTFDLTDLTGATNDWYNVYEFSMGDLATHTNETSLNDSILAAINVVPNPYYAYSAYETNRLDNRIKIVNLPDECTIRIYNISGGLIRTLTKSTNSITSVDWDLKNQKGVPIAGGVYLIHVDVPNVGERVLKWFGALRPSDMDNF